MEHSQDLIVDINVTHTRKKENILIGHFMIAIFLNY
jgi:hypothetical protein